MSLMRGFRRLDTTVLGEVPSTPAARIDVLRRFAQRKGSNVGGFGITAGAVVDLAERLDRIEQRLSELERRGGG